MRVFLAAFLLSRCVGAGGEKQPSSEAVGVGWDLSTRVHLYCAASPAGHQDEGGGSSPHPGASLVSAISLVRHGDRSNIGKLPGAPRAGFLCGEPSAARAARAVEDLRPFRSSVACLDAGGAGPACEGVGGPPLGAKFDNALPAWGRARAASEACSVTEGGELSSVGWEQLHAVGGALGRAYRGLLAEPADPRRPPLHVHSTDTGRTAWSAAALVNGLLAELLPERGAGEAAIRAVAAETGNGRESTQRAGASLNSAGEASPQPLAWSAPAALPTGLARALAHNRSLTALLRGVAPPPGAAALVPGLELPLPLHVLPRDEEFMLWPKKAQMCARAALLQFRTEEDIFQHQVVPADVAARIMALARVSEEDVPTTEECADDLLTRRCHAHPRPCWGAAGCLTSGDEASIIKRCDEGYGYRFSNEVTRLLTYPMLNQLAGQLRRAAELAQAGGAAPPPRGGALPRVQLRSVHDTVIAPLLASLGALDPVYSWPSYASRVSLELWLLPAAAAPGGLLPAGAPPGDAALLPLVRLLYNGEDVTARLACAVATPSGAAVCPLAAFEAQVKELLGGFNTWDEACFTSEANNLPPPEEHAPNGRPRGKGSFVHGSDVGPGRG
jgi:hypothetical protein